MVIVDQMTTTKQLRLRELKIDLGSGKEVIKLAWWTLPHASHWTQIKNEKQILS